MSRIQVITGVERRRRFSLEEKKQIVAEATEPGVFVSAVARRHEISPSLLFSWKKAFAKDKKVSSAGSAPLEVPSGLPFVRVIPTPAHSIPSAGETIRVRVADDILVEFPITMGIAQLTSFITGLRG